MATSQQVIAVLPSRNQNNKDILRILDYDMDIAHKVNTITFLYRNAKYTEPIQDIITDQYDVPVNIGERYIAINNCVYFVDDINDLAGIWDY